MRKLVIAALLAVSMFLIVASASQAHFTGYYHRHYYDPWDYPYGYGYPYGYPGYWPPVTIPQPPVIVQPTPPTTYIEKQPEQKPTEPQYLSYCKEEDKFYTEIGKCSSAWLKVVIPPPAEEETKKYWPFCREKGNKGFYPYISECPSGWLYVIPETNPPTK